jgi:hypothetical protein
MNMEQDSVSSMREWAFVVSLKDHLHLDDEQLVTLGHLIAHETKPTTTTSPRDATSTSRGTSMIDLELASSMVAITS